MLILNAVETRFNEVMDHARIISLNWEVRKTEKGIFRSLEIWNCNVATPKGYRGIVFGANLRPCMWKVRGGDLNCLCDVGQVDRHMKLWRAADMQRRGKWMQWLCEQAKQESCEETISAICCVNHEITKATTAAPSAIWYVEVLPTAEPWLGRLDVLTR